ncbi:hypothetical protein ScPMuIL_017494 [Solemya velum]
MSKKISQQTFDDVVKENIEEFDMTPEEAIEDAAKQFESQGVDLSTIVQEPRSYAGDGEATEHLVLTALRDLKLSIETASDQEKVLTCLKDIKSECDVDLSRRCLAGSNEAYPLLMKSLENFKTNPICFRETLLALCSLMDGQPDLLNDSGSSCLIDLIEEKKSDCDLLELLVRLIRLTCMKHETNRQSFVKKNIITILSELLQHNKKSPKVVKEVCSAFRVLTYDDDIRVPFGKAHEHAKMIVTEGDALKNILELCEEYSHDIHVLAELFSTMSCLVVRNEFCQAVMEMKGLEFILKCLDLNMHSKGLVHQILGLLKALEGNDEVKVAVVKNNGVELIVAAMAKHQANPLICKTGCSALATVALRNPAHCKRIFENYGHQVVLQAMQIHKTDKAVQQQGCMAVRNMVARCQEFCPALLELGAESLINDARRAHKECEDDAKAALRDLGCQVELKELWTGQRGELTG